MAVFRQGYEEEICFCNNRFKYHILIFCDNITVLRDSPTHWRVVSVVRYKQPKTGNVDNGIPMLISMLIIVHDETQIGASYLFSITTTFISHQRSVGLHSFKVTS